MPTPPHESKEKNGWTQIANYAQLGLIFPAATVVGWLIGIALDHWLHTSWLYIVGLIMGIITGFVELIRIVSKKN